MKKLILSLALIALFTVAFGQSKLDNLTDNPAKQDGHFVGKTGKVVSSDPYMASYSIAFDFWLSSGEPVYMFHFKWDMKPAAGSNTVKVNNVSKRYSDYPEVLDKMKRRLTPLTSMKDSELLAVPLYIQLRQGSKVLAHVLHMAKIDLPDPAGKWNVFALPSTNDWIKEFEPLKKATYVPFATAGVEAYDYKLQNLHKAGDKEGYKTLMTEIFKEADNIKVAAGAIYNIRWDVSDYEYAVKEKVAEQKKSTTATASKTSELDELLGSTGYSQKDKAAKNTAQTADTERADAAYHKITDYKDKTALNEAKRLYQEAAANPEAAAYAKNQIAMIDRVLNYKELDISGGDYVEIDGVKWATRNVGEPGKFVDKPEDYGNYYTWEEACKVCPKGWRLPTKEEFEKLIASSNKWIGKGREFAERRLYFPAAGYRGYGSDTSLGRVGLYIHYWSSTVGNSSMESYNLTSYNGHVNIPNNNRMYGFSVRCVKE